MMFRHKNTIPAWQNNGKWKDFIKWLEAALGHPVDFGQPGMPDITRTPEGDLIIVTRRGQMICNAPRTEGVEPGSGEEPRIIPGDWVFRSIQGEILSVDTETFDGLFEMVPDAHKLETEYLDLESLTLQAAVYTALGSSASCWTDVDHAGSFLASECARIGEQLMSRVETEVTEMVAVAMKAGSELKDDVEAATEKEV